VHTSEGRKRRTLYGKTRQEVAAKLSKALADREGGLMFDAGSLTVGEYLTHWLSDSVKGTVRISTFERHEQIIRTHLAPTLGRVKLKVLTPAHVRSLHREKLDAGPAPATVRKCHSTLHKVLSQAVQDGLISRNAADVKAPRPAPDEMRRWVQPVSATVLASSVAAGGVS
jgi:integrase